MVIDRCLRKFIGEYEFCKPIRNGNLIVMCKSSIQMNILLNQDYFSDGITGTSNLSVVIKANWSKRRDLQCPFERFQ